MKIITLLTPKSVRLSTKGVTLLYFVSSQLYATGDVIEIIDGRKKTLAVITGCGDVSEFKQEIRMGTLKPTPLPLSKSGPSRDGVVLMTFSVEEVSLIIARAKPEDAGTNKVLKKLLIKRAIKNKVSVPKQTPKAESFSEISVTKYFAKNSSHTSPKNELIDEIRKYFRETARFGVGSFPYYIGMFKKIPLYQIKPMFEEAKRSNKSLTDQKKLFWWKVGNYLKKKDK